MSNERNPVLEQFKKGYFTVNKTDHPFSNMGVNQAHQQNNKVVKVDDGGSIGILENETTLLKWAVAGPIMSDLLNQTDQDLHNTQKLPKYHGDTDLYEKNFKNDRNSILEALMEDGNPFCEEESILVKIVLKHVLDENATSSARCARENALNQFDCFVDDQLRNGTTSLYDNITKNNLLLFRSKNTVVTSSKILPIQKQIDDSTQICLSPAKTEMAILIIFLHMRIMPTLALCQNMGNGGSVLQNQIFYSA